MLENKGILMIWKKIQATKENYYSRKVLTTFNYIIMIVLISFEAFKMTLMSSLLRFQINLEI